MDTSSVNHIGIPLQTTSQNHQHDENADSRNGDAYINEDPDSCSQDSVIASKAFSLNRTGLPNKNEVNLSKMKPLYASGPKISNGKNSSQRQHVYKSKVTSPTRSSTVSPSVRALGSRRQSGQPGQAQQSKSIQLGKDPPSPVKKRIPALKDSALSTNRSGPQKTSATCQVWQKKTEAEPSACQSKLSSRHTAPTYDFTWNGQQGKGQRSKLIQSCKDPAYFVKRSRNNNTPALKDSSAFIKRSGTQKASATQQVWQKKTKAKSSGRRSRRRSSKRTDPIHHITWNGFDELCEQEPLGLNCHVCEEDLSYAPRDNESEYYDGIEPNLPDVAVLLCGHAFHVKCLLFLTSEEGFSDPQCYLCPNC